MLRSSWQNDATLLAVKSGYTWNHAHADAGSFTLFKQGVPLIIDSGTCPYHRHEYTTYYRQSRAHNVVLFNGSGQPEEDVSRGCKFPGHLHSLIDGLGMKYIYADATGPMARWFSRNYRHWLWSGDVILILDDVRAHEPGQLDWLLHYDGQYTTRPDGGVSLKSGEAEAIVQMLYPPAKIREEMGLAVHNPDKNVPYLVFSPETPARSSQIITAICLNPDALPKFEILKGDNYIGIRMRTSDAVEECYLNIRAINTPGTISLQIEDWITDAYLLHVKRTTSGDQPVQRFFLGNGSYLRHNSQSVIESLSKLTACWSPGDSLEVFSDEASRSIQIAAERSPASIQWNGRQVAAKYDGQTRLVSLDAR